MTYRDPAIAGSTDSLRFAAMRQPMRGRNVHRVHRLLPSMLSRRCCAALERCDSTRLAVVFLRVHQYAWPGHCGRRSRIRQVPFGAKPRASAAGASANRCHAAWSLPSGTLFPSPGATRRMHETRRTWCAANRTWHPAGASAPTLPRNHLRAASMRERCRLFLPAD